MSARGPQRRYYLPALVAVWIGLAAPPAGPASHSVLIQSRPAMGTSVEIRLVVEEAAEGAPLLDAAFGEIERVEQSLSRYRPTSEVSRINRLAGAGEVTTDPEVFGLLWRARELARRSGGAFDVTVGRLVEAWGFFRGAGRVPTAAELDRARAASGWRLLELDPVRRTVRFGHPGLRLDLGSLGKGYALDRAARALGDAGVVAALLGAGGSTWVALGAPRGESGWRIRIGHPLTADRSLTEVRLRDGGLSTSSPAGKLFERRGRSYGHLIDPRSGRPVAARVQATVMAADGETSDALATALAVLGPRAGAGLIRQAGARALVATVTGTGVELDRVGWPRAPGNGEDVRIDGSRGQKP